MSTCKAKAESSIAFDFDGTIVDCSKRQIAAAERALLEVYETPCKLPRFWEAKRTGATTLGALIISGIHPDVAKNVDAVWRSIIESDTLLAIDRPFPRIISTLSRLKEQGTQLYLLSARKRPEALLNQLETLNLANQFVEISVVDPQLVIQEKSQKLLSWKPDLYVGDSETDAEAAELSDTRFASVSSGQRSEQYLTAHGINKVYPDAIAALRDLGMMW